MCVCLFCAVREPFFEAYAPANSGTGSDVSDERAMLSLTWEQIGEMDRAVGFLRAHTMNHPILACIVAQNELCYECKCVKRSETAIGHAVTSFAIPIGQWQHIIRVHTCCAGRRYRWP